jgi:uncharacterized protein YjbJ (UPF0337 family)
MTQSTYSGSLSNVNSSVNRIDNRDDSDNQTSSEIRADIDQTRASVGEKLDQLQARLDPNRLKAQAQETVQEMISDTANSMTEYVRTHKDEMVHSLADSARRNPLPTALVGLGLGWLLLESLGGKNRDDDYEYERRNFRSRERNRFEGSTGRSNVSQGRGQTMEEDYYAPQRFDAPDYGRSGYPVQSGQTYSTEFGTEYRGQAIPGYNQEYGNGHHRNPVAKATDAVKDTISDVSQEVKDRVEDLSGEIKDRVQNMSQDIKERVGDMKDRVGDMGQEIKERVSDNTGQMGERMRDQSEYMRYQAALARGEGRNQMRRTGQRMEEWERRARWEAQRRSEQAMRNLEDNPLTYGALALAAGAALALLLPQTRQENRYFGEMRDELMDEVRTRGQEVMETAKVHAQQVVEEVRPELEDKARKIVEDVKQTGKEALKGAADEIRPVVEKAVEKGKQEARGAAQDVGVDPDKIAEKLGGKKPALNRDTLAGQWKQVSGNIKSKWGQLTDDEVTKIEGDYEKLVGAIQTRYGYTRAQTEQQINDFFKSQSA